MVINTNMMSMKILNIMNYNASQANKHMMRVSSGLKINSAADDPSGYNIAQRMDVRIRSLNQAIANAKRGQAALNTAAGGIDSTVEILRFMKEKAIAAANGTMSKNDRRIIQDELDQLMDQINDNSNITFNGRYLIDGSQHQGAKTDTKNVYTNEALDSETNRNTLLTQLADSDGRGLNIAAGDTVTLSYVQGGETHTSSLTVRGDTKLSDIFALSNGNLEVSDSSAYIGKDASGTSVYTADGEKALSVSSGQPGTKNSIAGFTIGVFDKDGNTKTIVNQKLDAFSEQIQAADKGDNRSFNLQVGAGANQSIPISIGDMSAQGLGLQGADDSGEHNLSVMTKDKAMAAINTIDNALKRALRQQTQIGAQQMRLEYTIANLTREVENLTGALSTIQDANMAEEITKYTKYRMLEQVAQAMLAQSNQSQLGILSLLK